MPLLVGTLRGMADNDIVRRGYLNVVQPKGGVVSVYMIFFVLATSSNVLVPGIMGV